MKLSDFDKIQTLLYKRKQLTELMKHNSFTILGGSSKSRDRVSTVGQLISPDFHESIQNCLAKEIQIIADKLKEIGLEE